MASGWLCWCDGHTAGTDGVQMWLLNRVHKYCHCRCLRTTLEVAFANVDFGYSFTLAFALIFLKSLANFYLFF